MIVRSQAFDPPVPESWIMQCPHALTLVMTAAGRFLMCEECGQCLKFPFGINYDSVAKQFPCCFVNPPKDVIAA